MLESTCLICGFVAPYATKLRDHLITVHPGQENKYPDYPRGVLQVEEIDYDYGMSIKGGNILDPKDWM